MVSMTKRGRRWLTLAAAALTAVIGVPLLLSLGHAGPFDYILAVRGVAVRWDIISIPQFTPVVIFNPGGQASAVAMGTVGAKITLTGSGTFVPEEPGAVTGGGTWQTFDMTGTQTGMGTYQVTGLVKWNEGPGTQPPGSINNIARIADFRAGLAVLAIAYSDGSRGILVVSCRAPMGGLATSPEGTSVSKDVLFFNMVAPTPNVDGNRTAFHLVPRPVR
jgi:hypothetical protein